MEKYAEADILKEVKSCFLKEDYDRAVELLKTVDISKVKSLTALCTIGEVFIKAKKYEEAEAVLLRVYDKAPNGRKILNLLTTLYINMGVYIDAEYYYKEFIAAAPKDLHRYILRYQLDRKKGERLSILINTLERLNEYEYTEEWAYELALLYNEAGEKDKAIKECTELEKWFGHGEYVDKAVALRCELTDEPIPEESIEIEEEEIQEEDQEEDFQEEDEIISEVSETDIPDTIFAEKKFDQAGIEGHTVPIDHKAIEALIQAGESGMVPEESEDDAANQDKVLEKNSVEDRIKGIDADHIANTESEEIEENAEIITEENTGISEQAEVVENLDGLWKTFRDDKAEEEADNSAPAADLEQDKPKTIEEAVEKFEKDPEKYMDTDVNRDTDPLISEFGELLDEDDDSEDEIVEESDPLLTDSIKRDAAQLFSELLVSKQESMEIPNLDIDLDSDPDDEIFEDEFLTSGEDSEADDLVMDSVDVPDSIMSLFKEAGDITGVKKQLKKTFSKFETATINGMEAILDPEDINFVVTGDDGNMKTQIAIGIAKALDIYGLCDKKKIVRSKAQQLNDMDFSSIFEKIPNGCLIIEDAGALEDTSLDIISAYTGRSDQNVSIVLEDSKGNMHNLWKRRPTLRVRFLNVIDVGSLNENELIGLAKSYAEKKGYELSEEASMVTLRGIFEKWILEEQPSGYEEVMAIVDQAVLSLEARNKKNIFMTVLDNAYKEASMFTLLPEDFEQN